MNIPDEIKSISSGLRWLLLHRYSRLNVQIRIKDWEKKVKSLDDLEKLVWGF
jgi:hypothetical protein